MNFGKGTCNHFPDPSQAQKSVVDLGDEMAGRVGVIDFVVAAHRLRNGQVRPLPLGNP